MAKTEAGGPVQILSGGQKRTFDIEDPVLPDWVAERVLTAGNYPYEERLKRSRYAAELQRLQIELVKVQAWLQETGGRVIAVFEGRDAAGKGGVIKRVREYMNPRHARIVALPKPTDRERGEWYFQRYVGHFPTAGEAVLFDRSWYNRAVVEPVMGFCTPEQTEKFLAEAPAFEKLVTADGIHLFKFWLNIGRETQLKRFHDRRHDPLKVWKLSPVDLAGLGKWDDYTAHRDRMFAATDTRHAPWIVVRANDKRRARLNLIRHILRSLDYAGRDREAIGSIDPAILGRPQILGGGSE